MRTPCAPSFMSGSPRRGRASSWCSSRFRSARNRAGAIYFSAWRQHFHLLRVFRVATSQSRVRHEWTPARVARGVAAQSIIRHGGNNFNRADALNLFSGESRTTGKTEVEPRAFAPVVSGRRRHPFHARFAGGVAAHRQRGRARDARVERFARAHQSHLRLSRIHAAQNLSASARKLKLRVGEGVTGWVAQNGKPVRVGDVTQDKRYVSVRRDVRSELAVPLEVQGEVRGVINVDSERGERIFGR